TTEIYPLSLHDALPIYGLGFAQALCCHRGFWDSLLREVAPDRLCTPLREVLVIGIATNAVGVALDSKCERGIGEHDPTDLGQLLARQRAKCVLAGVEENVRHVDD